MAKDHCFFNKILNPNVNAAALEIVCGRFTYSKSQFYEMTKNIYILITQSINVKQTTGLQTATFLIKIVMAVFFINVFTVRNMNVDYAVIIIHLS